MARGVKIVRRRKNSASELPYNEWIPVHAVKFNDDKTVSLMTDGRTANRGRRRMMNVAGYKDASGIFDPIRWDPEYDPEEVGEPLYSSTHSGLPGRRRKKSRKAKARRRRR
jgi:hypothetical protein